MSQQNLSREVQEIWALFRETSNQIREVAKRQKEQPYNIFIQNLRHPTYRLRHSIPVSIERNDDTIIATYHDLDMHSKGRNVSEALDELCERIIQHYETLKADEKMRSEAKPGESACPSLPLLDSPSSFGNLDKNSSQEYAFLKQIIDEGIKKDRWLEIRGIFADDPDFDSVMKEIEAYRKELNEAYWKELDEGGDNE